MLFSMAIILGLISAILEIKLVKSWPWFAKIMENGVFGRAGTAAAINIGFSMGLSVLIGMFFGAGGLVVMFAGVISTVMTQPYYKYEKQIIATLDKLRFKSEESKVALSNFKTGLIDLKGKLNVPMSDLFKMILFTIKVITTPIRMLRWSTEKYHASADKIQAFTTKAKSLSTKTVKV